MVVSKRKFKIKEKVKAGILISLVIIPFWILIMLIMKVVYSFMNINTPLPIIEVSIWTIFYSTLCPFIYYCYSPLWKLIFSHLKISEEATFNLLSQTMTLLNGIFCFLCRVETSSRYKRHILYFSITLGHQLIGHITGLLGTIVFSFFLFHLFP